MTTEMKNDREQNDREEFLSEADADRIGLAAEFWDFLKHNKKWWLIPILGAFVIIGLLAVINPAAVPFIYPFF